jgi:hypothetical protein
LPTPWELPTSCIRFAGPAGSPDLEVAQERENPGPIGSQSCRAGEAVCSGSGLKGGGKRKLKSARTPAN